MQGGGSLSRRDGCGSYRLSSLVSLWAESYCPASQASWSQQILLLTTSLLFISHLSTQQHPGDTGPLFSHVQKAESTSLEAYV